MNMQRQLTTVLIGASLLALAACGSDDATSQQASDRPLVDTVWVIDGLISGDDVSTVPENSEASITISDGRAAVHTGCNRGNATVDITDETMTFSPMATTMMACEPALMELEFAVTSVLNGEVDYAIDADRMTISTQADDGTTIGLTLIAE
jgi:heat shock protein HslJ